MNKCKKNRLLISRYLDNDLNATELLNMKNHISRCGKCRQVKEDYRVLQELLLLNKIVTPVVPAVDDCSRYGQLTRGPWLDLLTWKSGFAGAFAIIIVTVAVYLFQDRHYSMPAYVLENSSAANIAMPLGSLVYYEEFAGQGVQSQFVRITSTMNGDRAIPGSYAISYQSPFFNDSLLIATRYEGAL